MRLFRWIALAQGMLLGASAGLAAAQPREIAIVVDHGYTPDEIVVREGEEVRLIFTRRDRSGCTREVVIPSLGIRRELPTGEAVAIELGPLPAGTIEFHCGMKMVFGSISVVP